MEHRHDSDLYAVSNNNDLWVCQFVWFTWLHQFKFPSYGPVRYLSAIVCNGLHQVDSHIHCMYV